MENQPTAQEPQANSYDTAVSVIGAVFGITHFMLQSAADLVAYGEGKLVEKISDGEIKAAQRIEFRKNETLVRQDKVLQNIEAYKAKMKAMQQPKPATAN